MALSPPAAKPASSDNRALLIESPGIRVLLAGASGHGGGRKPEVVLRTHRFSLKRTTTTARDDWTWGRGDQVGIGSEDKKKKRRRKSEEGADRLHLQKKRPRA